MTYTPQTYRFFLMTVDPVHVGTGGTRLGRVDLSIVREPGTNLPKIPGSSLHGVIRTYAAHRYGKPQCAGQGQQEGRKHCGRPTCPICYTFGYARDQQSGHAGVVAIADARILLFPVYSMVGPVWVTSPAALYSAGFGEQDGEGNLRPFSVDTNDEGKARWDFSTKQHLNLGWLMVSQENGLPPSLRTVLPNEIPDQIRNRVVLVSDKLFSQIVNSNLEVRTSVAINPETGAAEEGALFTYEAVPRATVLWMDVVVSDYRDEFPTQQRLEEWEKVFQNGTCTDDVKSRLQKWRLWKQNDKDEECRKALTTAQQWLQDEKVEENGQTKWRWERQAMRDIDQLPLGVVRAGLEWAKHLGVGGMGTRGFGRIHELACREVENHIL